MPVLVPGIECLEKKTLTVYISFLLEVIVNILVFLGKLKEILIR